MPCLRVHQVHSGAVAPIMLAIRGWLRARGFDSGIFAGDGGEPAIHPADALPSHADQVLLVHSTDLDLASVQAPKILLHHGVAPPPPDRFIAALAATEPQAVALRRLGFQAVRSCGALFDPAGGDLAPFWRALAFAGALPRADARTRAAMTDVVRFTIAGHVAKTYSLAAVNRDLSRTIDAQRPGCVRLLPVEGEPTADLSEVPAEDRAWVAALAGRAPFPTGPEIVISSHYPVHVPPFAGDAAIALFYWEESLIPAETVARLNRHFAGVFAASGFVARALVNSGVTVPVLNVGQAPRLESFTRLQRRSGRPFTLLHVSSAFPRKGLDVLLAAWARAFPDGGGVRLVIKTFPNPHNDAAAQVQRVAREHPGMAPIALIDCDLDQAGLLALFADADAMVLPTRGEGYNLAAAEAMAAGLPLIVTGFGGHRDFCDPATARLLKFRFAASRSHLAAHDSLWAEPDPDDLVAALREAAAEPPLRRDAARAAILAQADPAPFVARLAGAAVTLLLVPPPQRVRIAWISPWGAGCDVADHSRAVLAAMPRAGIERLAILCETGVAPDAEIRPCWRPGGMAASLIRAAMQEDADFVMVQHRPDLLSWGELASLLRALMRQRRAVAVTLHALAELSPQDQPMAADALASVARVLVASVADMNRLADLGLAEAAALFRPGTSPERLHGMILGLVAQNRVNAPLDGSVWPGGDAA